MKQEIAAVPASRFGLHLSDEAHPAARGYVRDDLTREGALRVPELPRGWHFAPEAYDGIAGWWNWGGAEPLLITGPAGSGKTASVLAFCAVMQMPAVVFTARQRSHGATAGYSSSMSSQRRPRKSGSPPMIFWKGFPSKLIRRAR